MKRVIISFAFLFFTGFILLQCKSATSEDAGGSGADFDSSQYYTKTEVDAKIAATQPQASTETVASNLVSGTGYSNGTSVFTVPSGFSGVIYQIVAQNNDTMLPKTINVHVSADNASGSGNGQNWSTKFTIPANTTSQVAGVTRLYAGSTGVRGWLDASSDWGTLTVKIFPIYWLK